MKEEVQISIVLDNKPGELAKIIKKLTDNGIKIKTVTGEAAGDRGVIRVLTDNPEKAVAMIEKDGYKYAKDKVVSVEIKDTNALRGIIEKLGNNNLNIKSIYLQDVVGENCIYIFVCDDFEKTKKTLMGEQNGAQN